MDPEIKIQEHGIHRTNSSPWPKPRMAISAPARFSASAWPCWAASVWASTSRAAATASAWSPSSKSTAAPPTPSASSPAAGWASARSSSATGARWRLPLSTWPEATRSHPHRRARIVEGAAPATLHPEIENKNQQQMLAYREMPDADLFSEEWVRVDAAAERISRLQRRAPRLRPAAKASTTTASSSATGSASASPAPTRRSATTSRYKAPQIISARQFGIFVTNPGRESLLAH